MDVQQQKRQLREDIRRRLQDLTAKERAAESRSLCRRILELLSKEPTVIAAFASLQTEPNIWPLLLKLLERHSVLYLPRVEGGTVAFRKLIPLDEVTRVPAFKGLQRGTFGILEPQVDAPILDPATLSLALIPGVAFDRAGNRLGRGNGGYDHWIAAQRRANPGTKFWGISFECQLVQEVPVDAHDERMDAVVTARGMTKVSGF